MADFNTLKPGDPVYLRSNPEVLMTVVDKEHLTLTVECIWISSVTGDVHKYEFPVEALVSVAGAG